VMTMTTVNQHTHRQPAIRRSVGGVASALRILHRGQTPHKKDGEDE
jgi:hypothetical protein